MGQHFLLSAAARSLSAAKIMRMSDNGVEVFLRLRWPRHRRQTGLSGLAGCTVIYLQRLRDRPLVCAGAARRAAVISPLPRVPLFAWHKLPLRTYLLAIVAFCNEVNVKSRLACARDSMMSNTKTSVRVGRTSTARSRDIEHEGAAHWW